MEEGGEEKNTFFLNPVTLQPVFFLSRKLMTSSIVKTTHFKKTAPAELMKILLEEGYGTEASTELNKPFGKVFKASNIALPEKKDGPGIIVQSIRDPDWKTDAE